MIDRELTSRTPVRAAFAVLALSAVLLIFAIVHAIRGDTTSAAVPVLFDATGVMIGVSPRPSPDIGIAVESDLFDPDRTAPDEPYHLPGEERTVEQVVSATTPPPVVLGTAIMGEGRSFATCEFSDHTLIVRVGDKLGEFTVKSIERGRVVFTNASGKPLEITALKTGT